MLGDSGGPKSLVCCSPWGCRVRHDLVTEQQQHVYLNIPELNILRKKNYDGCFRKLDYICKVVYSHICWKSSEVLHVGFREYICLHT